MNPLVLIPPAVPLSRLAWNNCKEIPHKHVETVHKQSNLKIFVLF